MKKANVRAGIAAAALFSAGCGAAKTIGATELAKALATEITYDDTLEKLEQDEISMYMDIPEGVESVVYMGSGSTAEEVGVFTAKDSGAAKDTLDNVQDYLDDQQESFEDYKPEEAKRVGSTSLEQKGNYVILCVSADSDTARKVIEEAFK